jgi:rubredoxin
MKDVVRNWHCRNCGRSNATVIELDGTVKCDFCHWVMRIQPSRERGGETAGQMARRSPRMG